MDTNGFCRLHKGSLFIPAVLPLVWNGFVAAGGGKTGAITKGLVAAEKAQGGKAQLSLETNRLFEMSDHK